MHRFYLPPAQCQNEVLFLDGREAHHALRVLRIRRADRITVLDGVGREILCEVQDYDRKRVGLKVLETRVHAPVSCPVTLVQALPKGKLIESIIQKATELGAARIVPLLTERVVAHLDQDHAARKASKLQLVAVEAIKQCGAGWLPRVEEPLTPTQFLARGERFELPLIASLQPGSRSPRECLRTFEGEHGRRPQSACIWIGPEGDFTSAETEAILAHGALPITLGRLVLRVETAAIYCLSVLHYELENESPTATVPLPYRYRGTIEAT
jgi:16S rRNA (uracil1498-N3)-methyltransferase